MTRRRMLALALGAAAAAAGAAEPRRRPRPAVDVDVERYRAARAAASVTGRAFAERRRPSADDTPLTDTSLVLLPRSATLLTRLAALKAGARDSTNAYRGAVAAMRVAREDLEQALRDADAGHLVRTAMADPRGQFAFEAVPAGDWVLLAWHAAFVDTPSAATHRRERQLYRLAAPLDGYRAVSLWLRELTVGGDGRETIDLTDRNVWFSGVEEVKRAGADR